MEIRSYVFTVILLIFLKYISKRWSQNWRRFKYMQPSHNKFKGKRRRVKLP